MRSATALLACTAAASMVFSTASAAWGFTAADSFSADRFSATSADVSNRFLPMVPGTRTVFDGVVTEDGESTAHRVVTTITGVTKRVDGVLARMILDQDYDGDELAEQEIALYAQDDEGVVWELAEYPEEFEGGKFTGAPSTWVAGVSGARAGISMQAEPAVGTPEYNQGYAPDIEFDDRGKVVKTGQEVSDKVGAYAGAIVVDEYSAPEPDDGHQLKFHAPGRGVVRIEAVGGSKQETLQRTSLHHLDAADLAAVNATVLGLDQRAYTHAAKVWGGTARANGPSGATTPPTAGGGCEATPVGRPALRAGC